MEKKTHTGRIKENYIDYVLTHNEKPASVYAFMKKLRLSEATFYENYSSFEALEAGIWNDILLETTAAVSSQAEFTSFSAREKALTLFYGFTEAIKPHRSFIIYSFRSSAKNPGDVRVLRKTRETFNGFCENIIREGLESGELSDRKYLSGRYKDALWFQFLLVIRFWTNDNSADFEKTDEAIEKGVQLTFDLMGHTPIDNLIEYGKFLFRNARFAYEGAK